MQLFFEIVKTKLKLLLGKGVLKSYSQFGEDVIVQKMLRKSSGFYVDVGAYHPILYSNTYALYSQGWRGIVIDPNQKLQILFKIFRPRDTFINAAVGYPSDPKMYYEYNDGAYNSLEPSSKNKNLTPLRQSSIPVHALSELTAGIEQIDFMNIDVEGMDTEVLQTHDWSIRPTIIAIEGTINDASYIFLCEKGYELKSLAGLTMLFKDGRTI